MILRKLVVSNFRQLFGRNTIEFALPGDRNVTAILGENGSGKTTLLNAFIWALYGRIDLAISESVLSYKAIQDAAIGQDITAEVTVVFETEDAVYSATRSASFQKADGGKTKEVRPAEFRIDRVGKRDGATTRVPDPKQFVREILPEGLSKFFFFRGEDMEALASSDARSVDRLREGVESFMDIELLDRARKHADDLRRELEREATEKSPGDLKELGDKIETAERELESMRLKAAEAKTEVLNHESRKIEVEKRLAEVEETRPYLEKKGKLEERIRELERTEADRRKALAAILSADAYLWPSYEVLTTPSALAEAAAKRGELPAKIKPAFVDDRIALGECICGRPIDEAAKTVLMEWKKNKGLAGLDAEITELRSQLKDLAARRDSSWKAFSEARTDLANTSREIRQASEELSAVETELRGKDFKLDYVRELQRNLTTISDQIITARVEEARQNDRSGLKEEELKRLKDERISRSKGLAEVERLIRRATGIGRVAAALNGMRSGWVEIVQRYLDGKLKESWGKVAALERLVEFTPDFKLTMKEVGGHGEWTTAAPSQANQRALALAFVASLVKLAGDISVAEGASRRPVFKGGRYPLVMDAPFATMDQYFKETLPTGLQETVPQLVVISNFEQWEGEVADRLFKSVGKRYVLELHCDADDRFIDFQGDKVPYVIHEADCVRDWTTMSPVSEGKRS